MIEKAKVLHPNKNIEYICGNILDMEFENNSLDIIITTATAHHLPYEWLLSFAKDKLKKDDEHAKEVWERHGKHDTYMTMDEIRSLANKHIPTAKI